jgi:hypothetical protein
MDIIWKLWKEQNLKIITMWWLWWRERNIVREEELPTSVIDQAHNIKCTSAEFLSCYTKGNSPSNPGECKWRPPPEGDIKFNIGGAYVDRKEVGVLWRGRRRGKLLQRGQDVLEQFMMLSRQN